jgi:Bacterial Ig domain
VCWRARVANFARALSHVVLPAIKIEAGDSISLMRLRLQGMLRRARWEVQNMNPQDALRKKRLSFLLLCSVLLLFIASGFIGKFDGTAARHHVQIQPRPAALQEVDYEVILLPAPAPLTDSAGEGVGAGQAVGTGRIAGSTYPTETHAVLWPQGGSGAVDLHPPDFRYSAALDTDGQRQVGHGNGPPTAFNRHALLWQGSATSYVDLHPAGNWTDSIARAIAGDQQVGNINSYFYTSYERIIVEHAALWRGAAATVVDLHPSGINCERSYAHDTDGFRQVGNGYFPTSSNTAPYRALLWSGSAASVVVLHPAGYTHSFAEGVSGNEQVGYAFNTQGDGNSRALLWHGTAASVVSLHPVGYITSSALATNGVMQVGSGSTPATGSQSHALRWSGTAASVLDLHTLLPAEFSQGSSIAKDIDALGNIVGLAQRPDGSTVAVLWRGSSGMPLPKPTPTPTPTPQPTPTPTPTPINVAPSVQIISPTNDQVLNGKKPIQLSGRATDKDGKVAKVEFFANGGLIGTVSTGSADGIYKYSWRVSVRRKTKYSIQARATDNRGASALSQIVTVTIVP